MTGSKPGGWRRPRAITSALELLPINLGSGVTTKRGRTKGHLWSPALVLTWLVHTEGALPLLLQVFLRNSLGAETSTAWVTGAAATG